MMTPTRQRRCLRLAEVIDAYRVFPRIFLTLFFVCFIVLFCSLGIWQLERAEEKKQQAYFTYR